MIVMHSGLTIQGDAGSGPFVSGFLIDMLGSQNVFLVAAGRPKLHRLE